MHPRFSDSGKFHLACANSLSAGNIMASVRHGHRKDVLTYFVGLSAVASHRRWEGTNSATMAPWSKLNSSAELLRLKTHPQSAPPQHRCTHLSIGL